MTTDASRPLPDLVAPANIPPAGALVPGQTRPVDISDAELERRFVYHRPAGETIWAHEDIRLRFRQWATQLRDALPPGREKSCAFTALEEASFWAHAAIAREGH